MAHAALMSPLSILAVFGDMQVGTTVQRSGIALVEKLRERGFEVACRPLGGRRRVRQFASDPLIGAVIVDADLDQSGGAETVLRAFRAAQ